MCGEGWHIRWLFSRKTRCLLTSIVLKTYLHDNHEKKLNLNTEKAEFDCYLTVHYSIQPLLQQKQLNHGYCSSLLFQSDQHSCLFQWWSEKSLRLQKLPVEKAANQAFTFLLTEQTGPQNWNLKILFDLQEQYQGTQQETENTKDWTTKEVCHKYILTTFKSIKKQ